MNDMEKMRLRIIADNEQDRSDAEQWWRESTNAEKMRVWERIQKTHTDVADELVTRFAQLAFGEMMEKLGVPT